MDIWTSETESESLGAVEMVDIVVRVSIREGGPVLGTDIERIESETF